MTRRKFSREFKIKAEKLVRERGVSVAQACLELELSESVCGDGCGRQPRRQPRRFPAMARSAPNWLRSRP